MLLLLIEPESIVVRHDAEQRILKCEPAPDILQRRT